MFCYLVKFNKYENKQYRIRSSHGKNMFIIMRCKYNFLKTFIVDTKLIISKILNKSTTPL